MDLDTYITLGGVAFFLLVCFVININKRLAAVERKLAADRILKCAENYELGAV